MSDYDLTAGGSQFVDGAGTGTTDDDVLIAYTPPVGAGTGNYDTFLSIHHKDGEEGFNTETQNFLDTGQGIFTHSLLIDDVGTEIIDGVEYYVFRLDVNEPNSETHNVTLTSLKFYTSANGALGDDWNAGTSELGAGFVKIYDMDGGTDDSVDLSDHSSGSGTDDYFFYLPKSLVDANPGDYLTLYAAFSGTDSSNGGFEEFRAKPADFINPQGVAISIDKDTVLTNDTGNLLAGDSVEFTTMLVGTAITWTYAVSAADSDLPIPESILTVVDDNGTPGDTSDDFNPNPVLSGGYNIGDVNTDHNLDPTETWYYTYDGFVGDTDYVNIGEVSGTFDPGGPGETFLDAFDASGYFVAAPEIAIDKDTICADDGDSIEGGNILVGSNLTWVYTITNPGNVALSDIVVTDSDGSVTPATQLGSDSDGLTSDSTHNIGDLNNDGLLDPGEAWVYTAAGVAVEGAYANTGTASGTFTDDIGQTVAGDDLDDSEDSGYTGVTASIHLEKVTTGSNPSGSHTGDGITITTGSAVTWTYTVTNDGDVPLSNIQVTDDQAGVNPAETLGSDSDGLSSDSTHNIGDANNDGLLDVGEEWIFSASGVAVDGSYSNLGSATGEYTDDCANVANPSDDDGSSYTGISGPGVRTPGFWYNNGSLLWDGNANTFPKAGDLGIVNNPNTGTGPDLLYTVDTNHNGGIDGGDTKALLIGDWNKNGIADDEFDLFVTRADALSLLNASTKQQQDGRWMLGRDMVATWLNFLAGNGVGTASDLDSPHHYVDEGIAWMQHTTNGDNILLLTELTKASAVSTSSAAWLTGFDNVYGNNGAGVTNTYPIIDILAGSAIHTALDGYNNTGIINGHVYAFPDA